MAWNGEINQGNTVENHGEQPLTNNIFLEISINHIRSLLFRTLNGDYFCRYATISLYFLFK